MMGMINELSKGVGACERLVQTPIPLHYARHTSRFMAVFTLTLPLFLVQEIGYSAVPSVACVVWCLFGVQEIGLMIENPFATTREGNWGLPLDIFSRSIRHDVWECIDSVGVASGNIQQQLIIDDIPPQVRRSISPPPHHPHPPPPSGMSSIPSPPPAPPPWAGAAVASGGGGEVAEGSRVKPRKPLGWFRRCLRYCGILGPKDYPYVP
jgi:hypothetical protein